eukprot:239582-Chlamydomonas_euryale.AAC.2
MTCVSRLSFIPGSLFTASNTNANVSPALVLVHISLTPNKCESTLLHTLPLLHAFLADLFGAEDSDPDGDALLHAAVDLGVWDALLGVFLGVEVVGGVEVVDSESEDGYSEDGTPRPDGLQRRRRSKVGELEEEAVVAMAALLLPPHPPSRKQPPEGLEHLAL